MTSRFASDNRSVTGKLRPLTILAYHRLVDDDHDAIATSPRLFAEHMRWLRDHDFTALTATEFEDAATGGDCGARRVLITFDDGYESVFQFGLPILREVGFSAINFLITDKVGLAGHLTWEQVLEMEASGIFCTQSHSHSHERWLTTADMVRDIAKSRELLAERLRLVPERIRHLAWPWGRANPDWVDAARKEGYSFQYLVRTSSMTVATSRDALPRVCCDGYSLDRFAMTMRILSDPVGGRFMDLATNAWKRVKQGNRYGSSL